MRSSRCQSGRQSTFAVPPSHPILFVFLYLYFLYWYLCIVFVQSTFAVYPPSHPITFCIFVFVFLFLLVLVGLRACCLSIQAVLFRRNTFIKVVLEFFDTQGAKIAQKYNFVPYFNLSL